MSAYQDLEARFRRLGAVEGAIGVLHWDTAAMMPAGGGKARAEQTATLRGIAHAMLTAPEIGDLLAAAEIDTAALGPWQHANLREMRRRWRHAAAVSGDLVETLSHARSASEAVWRQARLNDDFAAALLDNAIAGGESQAGSFALLLGGEERFKQVGLYFVIHAGAGIADGERGVVARRGRQMLFRVCLIQVHVRGLDG